MNDGRKIVDHKRPTSKHNRSYGGFENGDVPKSYMFSNEPSILEVSNIKNPHILINVDV